MEDCAPSSEAVCAAPASLESGGASMECAATRSCAARRTRSASMGAVLPVCPVLADCVEILRGAFLSGMNIPSLNKNMQQKPGEPCTISTWLYHVAMIKSTFLTAAELLFAAVRLCGALLAEWKCYVIAGRIDRLHRCTAFRRYFKLPKIFLR